jgi:hypothetical protein
MFDYKTYISYASQTKISQKRTRLQGRHSKQGHRASIDQIATSRTQATQSARNIPRSTQKCNSYSMQNELLAAVFE